MSYIEAPEKTLFRFATGTDWLSNPVRVIAKDLRSSGNESNREWDSFYYEEKEHRLFDPGRNGFIDETDGGDEAQKNANRELQAWFLTHDSGIAVKVSPSGGKYHYPDEQIEIYRITYDFSTLQKRLFCAFHQFHANFRNPEQMRRFVFPEEDKEESLFEIINWVEAISQQKIQAQNSHSDEKDNQYFYFAEKLKSGDNPEIIFKQMKALGLIGSSPIGCTPGGLSQPGILASLIDKNGWIWRPGICANEKCKAHDLVGPCGICKKCQDRFDRGEDPTK